MNTMIETQRSQETNQNNNRLRDVSVKIARGLGALAMLGGVVGGVATNCEVEHHKTVELVRASNAHDALILATAELTGDRIADSSVIQSVWGQQFLDKDTLSFPTNAPDRVQARELVEFAANELDGTNLNQDASDSLKVLVEQDTLDPNQILDASAQINRNNINNDAVMHLETAQYAISGALVAGGVGAFALGNSLRSRKNK